MDAYFYRTCSSIVSINSTPDVTYALSEVQAKFLCSNLTTICVMSSKQASHPAKPSQKGATISFVFGSEYEVFHGHL
jgi:GH24 family phage-related lysozyme (muramidase)